MNRPAELSMLAESIRKSLEVQSPRPTADGEASTAGREALARLDAFGMLVDEAHGGTGHALSGMLCVLEEAGRAQVGRYFMASAVLSAVALRLAASVSQQERYLPAIASGATLCSFAVTEASGSLTTDGIRLIGRRQGGGVVLSGEKQFVPALMSAEQLIVVAQDAAIGGPAGLIVAMIDDLSGLSRSALARSGRHGDGAIVFDGVLVPPGQILDACAGAAVTAEVITYGALAVCADMVGGAQRVLEMTVDHATGRSQFGALIASYPAVQRHCTDMMTDIAASRAIIARAVAAVMTGSAERHRLASMAKAWTVKAYRRVMTAAHLVHGAIGFSAEYGLHRFSRAQMESWSLWGDWRFHADRIAQSL